MEQKLAKTGVIRFIIVDNVFSEVRGVIFKGDAGALNNTRDNISIIGKNTSYTKDNSARDEDAEEGGGCCKKKKKRDDKATKEPLLKDIDKA